MWTRHDSRAAIAELSLARLAAARGGRPRPTVVVGEAGSGKTTLLDRVCAAATGVVIIRLRPGIDDVPYAPLHAALEPLLTTLAGSPRRELLVALHAATAPGVRVTSHSRPRVLSLMTMALEALDALTPVIVCVDDLHSADAETAATFWHLATHVHERRVWLLGATRNERSDLDVQAAMRLDRLAASDDIDVIELPPLSPEEIADLVRERAGSTPSDELVELLLERADGNAFYTVELLESLSRTGALTPSAAGLRLADGAVPGPPETVNHFVKARVEGIGHDALTVATRLAVLRSMPITRMPILANLAEISVRRTEQAFDQLVAAGVAVERDGRWRCSHDLTREALYDSLGPGERLRLHEQAATLLASCSTESAADVIEIAGHIRDSAIPPDPAAAQMLVDAGNSIARRSPAASVRWYRAAVDLLHEEDPARDDIILSISRVQGLSGDYEDAARLALETSARLRGARRQRAIELAISAMRAQQDWEGAAKVLDAALSEPEDRSARLLLQRANLATWTEDLRLARSLIRSARSRGLADDDGSMLEMVQMHLDAAAGNHSRAFRRSDNLRSRSDLAPGERANTRVALMIHACFNDDPATGLEDAAAVNDAGLMGDLATALTSWIHYRQGDFATAVADATRSLAITDVQERPANIVALSTLIAVAVEQDRLTDAVEFVRLAEPTRHQRVLVECAIARWEDARGDDTAAAARLDTAAERYRSVGRINYLSPVYATRALLAHRRGDHDAALRARHALLELPRHPRCVALNSDAMIADACVTADRDVAVQAAEHATVHGLKVDAATARALIAMLDANVAALDLAYNELGALGATARQRTVGQQLRRFNARIPTQRADGVLTGAEAQVAALVGQGLTNREIAAGTGLTTKTVETYVSRMLAKTGLSNRVKLALAIAAGELTADA